jgi:N-acetylglucosaminyldiphosphoundecaprenol N-acetyl-beta-D-mannosaminyltransferase
MRDIAASPVTPQPSLPTVSLWDVELHAITEQQCIEHILNRLDVGEGGWVVTANLDHLRRLVRYPEYASLCRGATLMVADGIPLVWASRLQGTPLPERVAGSDLISSLTAAASLRNRSVYLLGGDPGTAEAAAEVLRGRHGGLRIVGTYCPPLGFESDEIESARIRSGLSDARPDLVYVALGSPKQERLICRLQGLLPEAWWIGVGASFSFLCGDIQRAPAWVRRMGLEWLHRLVQEPGRLARRYLVDGLPFGCRLVGKAIRKRVARAQGRDRDQCKQETARCSRPRRSSRDAPAGTELAENVPETPMRIEHIRSGLSVSTGVADGETQKPKRASVTE